MKSNAEVYLERVRKLDYAINNLIHERDKVRMLATKVTQGSMDGMPHATGVSDKVGKAAVKLVMLEKEIDDKIDAYIDYKQEVVSKLMQLPAMQYQTLYLYYVAGKKMHEIYAELHYSRTHVDRIKRDGLKNLEKMLENAVE